MNDTDRSEIQEAPECPYCDGKMVDGQCQDCGWMWEHEYPPMEEE